MPLDQNATKTAEPLAAGKYWVGDPCYAFSNDNLDDDLWDGWSAWLNHAWSEYTGAPGGIPRINDGRIRGMRIVAVNTAHGDGEYPSNIGVNFPVDAGLIGAVHESFIKTLYPELEGELFGMTLVDFPEPFHLSYDEGTITIGHIQIETDDWGYDEDEDEL